MPKTNRSLDNPYVKSSPKFVSYLNIFVEIFGGSFIKAIAFTQVCYWRRKHELSRKNTPLLSDNLKLMEYAGISRSSADRVMHEFRKYHNLLESNVGKRIIFTEKGEKLYKLYVHTISNVKNFKRKQ